MVHVCVCVYVCEYDAFFFLFRCITRSTENKKGKQQQQQQQSWQYRAENERRYRKGFLRWREEENASTIDVAQTQ